MRGLLLHSVIFVLCCVVCWWSIDWARAKHVLHDGRAHARGEGRTDERIGALAAHSLKETKRGSERGDEETATPPSIEERRAALRVFWLTG